MQKAVEIEVGGMIENKRTVEMSAVSCPSDLGTTQRTESDGAVLAELAAAR